MDSLEIILIALFVSVAGLNALATWLKIPYPILLVLGGIALAEAFWFAWIFRQPLPNAANVGGAVRRADLLWRLFPGVIPGLAWEASHLGQAARQLSHVENLPERVPLLAGAVVVRARHRARADESRLIPISSAHHAEPTTWGG